MHTTPAEVLAFYEARVRELQIGFAQARLHGGIAAAAALFAAAMLVFIGLGAIRGQLPPFWPSAPAACVIAAAQRLKKQAHVQNVSSRLRRYYDKAAERVRGAWQGQGVAGDEFAGLDALRSSDLGLFGAGSLFELLCTARSAIGRRRLAEFLTQSVSAAEIRSRQEAVRELMPMVRLRERVALLGRTEFGESSWETIEEWLTAPGLHATPWLRCLALASAASVVAICFGALLGLIPWLAAAKASAPMLVAQAAIGAWLRSRVQELLPRLESVGYEMDLLSSAILLLEAESFDTEILRGVRRRVQGSSPTLRRLYLLLRPIPERKNEWFNLVSFATMMSTQICWAVEEWRRQHGAELRDWVQAWGEFEALNAIAGYAFENGDNEFPEIVEGEARLEAKDLGHPLLSRETCVRNDVELNRDRRLYLVSGSNMAGKSTMLRAMGLNAVLAAIGAPVRARAMRISQLAVCASIAVVDSLESGKSRFLAEVERLRETIRTAGSERVLFLIDEIFSGTNSSDRRIAAEAVIRTLHESGAIGAVSTHDLALTEIAQDTALRAINVHMRSRGEGDPMDFDYRLRTGVCTESNALSIARMAGVPV
jgi:hypothetical protein